jgi:hypothetical protein
MTDRENDPLVDVAGTDPELASTATNDAVAGETVLPQPGTGPSGPTGGNEREAAPELSENDLADEAIDLDEEQ